MSSKIVDPLFRLIKSLSKSEKRHFRLYVNRLSGADTGLFMQLFDVLDKEKFYDESTLLKKIKGLKRLQISNLKRHLYRQILTSLRLVNTTKFVDMALREQIDFAKILYTKGLYLQSLKILDKAKTNARTNHQDLLELEIIEFEKLIESRHITRSIENRADQLAIESERRNEILNATSKLSNLALRLYGLYIKVGHIRHEKDFVKIKDFFDSNLPDVNPVTLTFFEKINLYQSYVWYNYIIQNFAQCFRYATKWVDLFKDQPDMKMVDPDLYLRGMNTLLSAAFMTGYRSKLLETLEELDVFQEKNKKSLDTNSQLLAFQYYYAAKINLHFTEGTFSEGLLLVPEIEKNLSEFKYHLDQHRLLVFYYKLACLYFGSGDNERSLDFLNQIIQLKAGSLREDIQCFARFLHLIAHYELGNFTLLEYLVKSVYRFLAKMEDLSQVQQEILTFLRQTLNRRETDIEEALIQLRTRLIPLAKDPFEKRSFLYLDILSWLDSKIEKRPVQEIVQEKYLLKQR